MIDFNVKCPKNYPLKCNLLETEKEALVRSEKYKGFLMYQFQDLFDYVNLIVKNFFETHLLYVFDTLRQYVERFINNRSNFR
jgi:hypothetical protein